MADNNLISESYADQSESYADQNDRDPYAFYERLLTRGSAPVWDEKMRAWLLSSYAQCRDVMRADDVSFVMPERHNAEWLSAVRGGKRGITDLTGAEHFYMHAWWLRALAPRHMLKWRNEFIGKIVDTAIDRFIADGKADLAAQFAPLVPIRAIAALLGLPWGDDAWMAQLYELNERVLRLYAQFIGSGGTGGAILWDAAVSASNELNALLTPVILARQQNPGDDMISALWRDGGSILEDFGLEDMLPNVRMMIQGGADTTVHGIRNAIWQLLRHPELKPRLQEEAGAVEKFVEEVLRLTGPVHFRSREAIHPVTIGGATIPAETAVIPITAAANRDPAEFPDPDRIDLDRPNLRMHFAFHHGARLCVGAALARAEIVEAVTKVLQRLPDMLPDADAPPPVMRGRLLRSYAPLNVVFTPAAPRG